MKKILLLLVLAVAPGPVRAQDYKVAKPLKFQFDAAPAALRVAGEVQSAVIPPKVNGQCPEGRFLVSLDTLRPPTRGLVLSRRLDNLDRRTVSATFDLPPDPNNYAYLTNDHDLVSLPNGDVFYITGAGSKAPLDQNLNPWFMATKRIFEDGTVFGPGAHGVVLTWRSTDCGRTFTFVSVYDPAFSTDANERICENPQFRKKANGSLITATPYDLGGSDGQLVRAIAGRMYLTYQCVGYRQDATKPGFVLDAANTVNETLVARADKQGNWSTLGVMKNAVWWRFGITGVTGNPKRFAFGLGTFLVFGQENTPGKLDFGSTAQPIGTLKYPYSWDSTFKNNSAIPKDNSLIWAYMWANTIVSRIPGSTKILLAYPATIDARGHGYQVVMFDPATNKYLDLDPIVPQKENANNVVMHLTAIDNGVGPVLLYWYDLNFATKTAQIRGRFIVGENFYSTEDIAVRKLATPIDLMLRPGYWYGDYHTADGYRDEPVFDPVAKTNTYTDHYFPVWVEPDASVDFTEVTFTRVSDPLNGRPPLNVRLIREENFRPAPPPVDRARIRFDAAAFREHEQMEAPQLPKLNGLKLIER